jgi:Rrf2 family transcriptional regulator, iron-sulfur cluster assembly transcription factor
MRLELTRRTELALRALKTLDGVRRRVKGAELAESVGSTPAFIAQVVAPLVDRGWVDSAPGPLGGYRSNDRFDDISLLELIEVMEGATDAGECVLVDRLCQADEPCALHEPWTRARSALMAELSTTSIFDVGSRSRPRRSSC